MIIGGAYEQLISFIESNENLAIDTETNSKNKRKALLMGFSLTTRDHGFYICVRSWDPDRAELRTTCTPKLLIEILEKLKSKKLRAWNGAYDFPVLKHNTYIDLLEYLHIDGMLLRHTVNENEFSYGLKDIARAEFGESAADEQQELKEAVLAAGGRWTKEHKDMFMAPTEVLAKYCIQDGKLTNRIIERDLPKLKADQLEKFFFEDEVMPLYREVTIPMEETGIALDLPLIEQTKTELIADIEQIRKQILAEIDPHLTAFKQWWLNNEYPAARSGAFAQGICAYAGLDLPKTAGGKFSLSAKLIADLPDSHWKQVLQQQERMTAEEVEVIQAHLWREDGCPEMFNLSSKPHLKKLFFDELKEEPLSRTELGNPQVDDEFLQSMCAKYKWCDDLHVYNRLNKILGTYVERPLELQENGRYYASFFQHRTVSGRYAGDLQQLPRQLEDGEDEAPIVKKYINRIRNFFIADEDAVLIDADYESLEPHIFAHISGEEKIRNIFRMGHDFYSTIAIDVEGLLNVSADKKAPNYLGKLFKALRQKAKGYSLGIPYGMGGFKLQFELNIPLKEAEKLVAAYLNAYPELAKWMKISESQALKQGFIRTQAGRLRRFPKLQRIYQKYGDCILDDLELWKQLHESPGLYKIAKSDRRELKNYLNNAKNMQIQSLAASIVNRAAIKVARTYRREGLNATIIANVHDELLVLAAKNHQHRAAHILQQEMENIMPLTVQLKAVPSIGTRYGEIK